MLKKIKLITFITLAILCILSFQPHDLALDANTTLVDGSNTYITEHKRLKDSSYLVAVRTPMPKVKAEMVRWWFSDYLNTTDHYKMWHPADHIWMDWENKKHGSVIGASHLVHEYIGDNLSKLRIQFVNPVEFFGFDPNNDQTFVICARIGFLEQSINFSKMCHVVINNSNGSEMRSRFWLGHLNKRQGNDMVKSPINIIGNGYLSRLIFINKQLGIDLTNHAKEEMSYLSNILPSIYRENNE